MSRLQLYLFGPPRLIVADRTIHFNLRKAAALLVYLTVTRQPHSREALTTLLWPEVDAATGRAGLRRTLHRLNQSLGVDLLSTGADTIALAPHSDLWLDVEAYRERAACLPDPSPSDDVTPECLARLDEAAAIYRDDFLAGFTLPDSPAFDEWQFYQQDALRRSLAQVLVQLIHIYQRQAAYEPAIAYARRWLAQDPLHEPAHVRLMELYALADQRAAALRQYEICTRILAEEMGVPPEAETTALAEAVKNRHFPPPGLDAPMLPATPMRAPASVPAAPHRETAPLPHNLPPQLTAFVGRTAEVAALVERLADPAVRLVTVTGPGGMGKTRLALQVAHHYVAQRPPQPLFAKGVWFVSLDGVSATSDLIPTIAEAAGSAFYTHLSPRQQLLDYLRGKQMLLLLDSFEHLMASADLLADILAEAPGVKLLVTSREPLNLQGEWQWAVAGLPFPEGEGSADGDTLMAYDAVLLFVQSAQRVKSNFSLEADRAHVLRLCRLVEGMPLAIELAAAWLNVLPCAQIVEQITANLGFLAARARNVPPRQRSLEAVFEHSWQLLGPRERDVLMRLSVFRGGFRWEAAEQVAGAGWMELVALLDKSLLRTADSGRYQMHELLRYFAGEKLRAAPAEASAALQRHQDHYLTLLQQAGEQLKGPRQQAALAAIGDEIENVRAAWARAAESDPDAVDAAAECLYHFFQIRSRYQEGAEAFELALQRLDPLRVGEGGAPARLRAAKLLIYQGAFHADLGDSGPAGTLLQQGMALAGAGGSDTLRAFALNVLGVVAQWQGRYPAADHYLGESLAMSRAIDDRSGIAGALYRMADCYLLQGRAGEAKRLAQESLAVSRELGRPDWIAHALDKFGFSTFMLGEYGLAQASYQESAALFEEIGHQLGLSLALSGLGWVALGMGGSGAAGAAAPAERAVAIAHEIGNPAHTATRLALLGQIRNGTGDAFRAKAAYEEGLALAISVNASMPQTLCLSGLSNIWRQLGDFRSARRYLRTGLQMAVETHLLPMTIEALVYWADVRVAEADAAALEDAFQTHYIQAVEVLALVEHHPAGFHLFRARAARLLAELAGELPPPAFAVAQARGRLRTLDEVVAQVLSDLQKDDLRAGAFLA